jgi:hypothetical protein
MLTVLTVFSVLVLIQIILVPVRPSRENAISIPSVRRNVCARRSRPASARGFLAHAEPREMSSRAPSAHKRKRSDALPAHPHGPVDHHCTHASGYRIWFNYGLDGGSAVCRVNVPGGQKAVSQAAPPQREIGHARQLFEMNVGNLSKL